MWWYTIAVLALWVVNPELRRLFEWHFGYGGIDMIPALPFLAVLPQVFSLTYQGGWRRLPHWLQMATWLWLGGFGYAFIVAAVGGNIFPGAYTFANFVLPITIGLWVVADPMPFGQLYRLITRTLFALTTLISIYGIIQYVVAPEWDTLWLKHVIAEGALSFGRPAPFQIRVFSVLNSPGPFGNFMALMLLAALPTLSVRKPWSLVQVPIWLVAFGLSLDRSGWLLFAIGALIYFALSPQRGNLLIAASGSVAMLAGLCIVLPAALGNETVMTTLTERFATFSDLDSDESGNERRKLYDSSASLMMEAPFGQGLGVFGVATKLDAGSAGTYVDSGIIARLVEMGFPGATLFLGALTILSAAILRVWRWAGRERRDTEQSVAAMAFALLVALMCAELSGDISGLLILTLWLTAGLALRAADGKVRSIEIPGFRVGTYAH